GLWAGESTVIMYATTIPITKEAITATFHRLIVRNINGDDISINPKKNDQVRIGCVSRKYNISLASEKRLVRMPATTASRKLPLIFFQNAFSLKLSSSFMACKSIALMECTSSE